MKDYKIIVFDNDEFDIYDEQEATLASACEYSIKRAIAVLSYCDVDIEILEQSRFCDCAKAEVLVTDLSRGISDKHFLFARAFEAEDIDLL